MLRRLILLVLVAVVACERSAPPTGPSAELLSVRPSFSFTGGSGKVLGSTNQGELIEIDFDAGTATLIGDAGIFADDSVGWTDIAFDDSGTLFGLSRIFFESDFEVHLYTIDQSTGTVLSDVGSMGDHSFTDFDHDGSAFYGNGDIDGFGGCCAQLFTVDASDASVTWISSDSVGFGNNPFDTLQSPFDPIQQGGFAVHPVTGDFWGIEALQSQATVLYRIDPSTGLADSIMKVGPPEFGYDALHILDDGTFIVARGGPFSNDSVLWEIDATPDSLGIVPISLIPLAFDPSIVGNLNGLAGKSEGQVVVTIESTSTSGAGDSSFISVAPENQISHSGTVTPSSLTASLAWSVEVLTPRDALVVGPAGGTGEVFDWTVPTQPSDRYAGYTHAQAVAAIDSPDPLPNGLRFGVALTATDDGGQEHASELVIVEQDIKDAIRQEYADFQRLELPERDSLGVFHTDHFTASELNHGDYGVFLATERMRIGLETVRTKLNELFFVDDEGLILTSGYRNPVHHILHAGATAPESEHQYGVAVDVALGGHTGRTPEEFFEDLRLAAQAVDVGVCWEPEQTIRDSAGGELNHAHLDWRAECPDDWGLN